MPTAFLASAVTALGLLDSAIAAWVYAYEGATAADAAAQAETWAADACQNGREQSPINIVSSTLVIANSLPSIDTFFTASPSFVKNTGNGFQLFETSPSTHVLNGTSGRSEVDELGTPKGYSIFGEKKYNFYQVHWHTPSENTVDGRFFPLEAHFVHQLDDEDLVGSLDQLAVIGLMYEWGECNEFLDYFWNEFPEQAGIVPFQSTVEVDLNTHLVNELKEGYYHWWGSLTTPPCTEGVNWNLLRKPQTVCQRQVDIIRNALDRTQDGIPFNNRVVQPLYHRVVTVKGLQTVEQSVVVEDEEDTIAIAALVVSSITIFVVIVGFVTLGFMLKQQQASVGPSVQPSKPATSSPPMSTEAVQGA